MSNEIKQEGTGNFAFQDIHDSEFNIFIGKSYEYNDLLDRLRILEENFSLTPEADAKRRVQISAQIEEQKHRIIQFKNDILTLAETFNRIEINSERLRRAREFFVKGEFGQARAVLEVEVEQMQDEQEQLLQKKDIFEKDTLPKLINNSLEFLILALTIQTDYSNQNRFIDAKRYFEYSIESFANKHNVFEYATLLHTYNQLPDAEKLFFRHLNEFSSNLFPQERARSLSNLALIHLDQNKTESASAEIQDALDIYVSLAREDSDYQSEVAGTLNNLANTYLREGNIQEALNTYSDSLATYRELELKKPGEFLGEISGVLNNLGVLHNERDDYANASKEFEEAVNILRGLVKRNAERYRPELASTLNNLAGLHLSLEDYENAIKSYEESLRIRSVLLKSDPHAYIISIAQTKYNLARLYLENLPDREKSIQMAVGAFAILQTIYEIVPYTEKFLQNCIFILRHWGLNDEDIQQLVIAQISNPPES